MARLLILAATFVSAFLLFIIQPLFAKFLLPYFGGTSSVWTISVFFYSVVLLLGYLYAAVITRVTLSVAGLLHGALLFAVLGIVAWRLSNGIHPLLIETVVGPTPALSVLLTLLLAVGLPVLLLASTSVITQTLYARITDKNPYPLYALSNLGSLSALIVYPLLVEPFTTLTMQSAWWVSAFALFACLLLAGWYIADVRQTRKVTVTIDEIPRLSTFSYRAVLLLAALPTFLLTAVTEQMSRGIASFPLLWIIPLVLYLLSFVVAFRDSVSRITLPMVTVATLSALAVIPLFVKGPVYYWLGVTVISIAYFVIVTYIHRQLYERRPAVSALGTFYVIMTAGGALGSGIVGLVLPYVFSDYYELYLVLTGLLLFVLYRLIASLLPDMLRYYRYGAGAMVGLIILVLVMAESGLIEGRLAQVRNFYGTMKVVDIERMINDEQIPIRLIVSGSTNHGQQVLDERYRGVAASYYGEDSGIDVAIQTLRDIGITPRVAVIGLGAGMMNAYCDVVDRIDYIEINPVVEELARAHFTYLEMCPEKTSVTIADGRLHLEALAQKGETTYDIIMVDAFTDDAIPMHLLTFEALATAYAPLLSENGIIAFHISNRYLNLLPAIAGMAEPAGYQAVKYANVPDSSLNYPTSWALVTAPKYIARLEANAPGASLYTGRVPMVTWTDEQSSILPILSFSGSPQ